MLFISTVDKKCVIAVTFYLCMIKTWKQLGFMFLCIVSVGKFPRTIKFLSKQSMRQSVPVANGAFPPQGTGRFSPQRCGTGRVSTAKKWA